MKRKLTLFLIITLCLLITGCAKNEKIKLVFWDSYYIGVSDADAPKKDWYITGAIKRFEKENKNIEIEYVNVEHSSETLQKYALATKSKAGPDIVTLWSSMYGLSVKEYLQPIDKWITSEEEENITGWDTVREGMSIDGDITYGYPTNDSGVTVLYYNKRVIKNLGLDFEKNPPKIFEEFLKVCEKIKDGNYVPVLLSYKEGSTTDAATISYWYGQMVNGSERFFKLASGETTFSQEKYFKKAIEEQQKLYLNGYVNADVLTVDESLLISRFINDKAAMILGNTWYIDLFDETIDNVGIITLPNISEDAVIKNTGVGGPGLLLGMSINSEYKEEAIKFMKFLMSKKEMEEFTKYNKKSIPNRKNIDVVNLIDNPLLKKHAELKQNGYVVWMDNILPTSVSDVWFTNASSYFSNKLTEKKYLEKLDNAIKEANE